MKGPSSVAERKAKFRLERMRIKEVSGVDKPANLRPFLLAKRDTMAVTNKDMPPAAPPVQAAAPPPAAPPPAAPAPAATGQLGPMPARVRQAVLDASASAIEAIQSIAMAVGEAPIDESAPIPPEISACFDDVAAMLMQLSESLEPAGSDLEMAKKPPVAAADAAPPNTPATPSAPPPQDAQKSIEDRVVELVRAEVAKGADLKASIDRLTLQMQSVNAKQFFKSLPTGNVQPSDGGKPAPPAPKWPDDLAAAAQQKRLEKARNDARGS